VPGNRITFAFVELPGAPSERQARGGPLADGRLKQSGRVAGPDCCFASIGALAQPLSGARHAGREARLYKRHDPKCRDRRPAVRGERAAQATR